jgi:hypothetical protein
VEARAEDAQKRSNVMRKPIALAFAGAVFALASGAAHAGNVYWSIGINAPPIGTVISNAPVYSAPAPVYYQPAPVYYEPAPVYVPPPVVYVRPRVVYRPVPVYYRPAPVVYGTYYHGGYYRGHEHHDEYGDRRDGGWQPVPPDPRRYRHDER